LRPFEEKLKEIWECEGKNGAFSAVLRFLSLPYGTAVALRNRLYDYGIFRQEKLPCPIVSVGNLTVGGTGKTPTVILLANLLKEKGCRPVVLSRGYGGNTKAPVNIVSDGNRLLMGWREAGDEPVLIAKSAPGVPVLTGPKRFLTGRVAVEHFSADVLILDDAFQHRALFRNLDILLVDAALPFGNGFLLPRGPLREPQGALSRVHLVIRTGGSRETEQPLPGAPSLPSFRGIHRPQGLVEAGTDRTLSLAELQGEKVCAFSGIASPEAFRESLTALGAAVVAFRTFPDHHPYGPSDLDALRRLAGESGAKRIITTEKDGVRLADFPVFLTEVSLLRIGMEITPAEPFAELIFSGLTGHNSRPSRGNCNHEA
jgi:tetraacyldisaccharide 4'-kinase